MPLGVSGYPATCYCDYPDRVLVVAAASGLALWMALVVLAPALPVLVAAPTYLLGSVICHQMSERSFHLADAQLPVCARCVGIYAGACAASLVLALRGPAMPTPGRIGLLAAAAPTIATVALEWAGLWQPGNVVRALAGAALGIGVALALFTASSGALHYRRCLPRRPHVRVPPSTPI